MFGRKQAEKIADQELEIEALKKVVDVLHEKLTEKKADSVLLGEIRQLIDPKKKKIRFELDPCPSMNRKCYLDIYD